LPPSESATLYSVRFTASAADDFSDLDGSVKKVALNQLEKLERHPRAGQQLANKVGCDLSAFRSLHFRDNRYRIVYRVEENTRQILVIGIGKRESSEIYRMCATRLSDVYLEMAESVFRNGLVLKVSGKTQLPFKTDAPDGPAQPEADEKKS